MFLINFLIIFLNNFFKTELVSSTLLLVVKRLYPPTCFVQLPLNFLGEVRKIFGATVSATV